MLPAVTPEWFNTPYYYALYSNRDDKEAAQFIRKLFTRGIIKPGERVLDLACGKGRHAMVMYDEGADVLGVDNAEDVIAIAKQFEMPGLKFAVHDMLDAFPWQDFDVVTNLFTSFGYFTHKNNQQVISNISGSLKKGGELVLDYLSAETVIRHLVPADEKVVGSYQFKMRRFVEDKVIYKEIKVWDENRLIGTFVEGVQAYSKADLSGMVAEAGLIIESTFGTYELDSPHQEGISPRLVIVARKA